MKPVLYVDADACPVKDEAVKVAGRHGLMLVFVANSGLRPSRDPMVRNVIVSGKFDAADDWIVMEAAANDVAVTADVPLAARLVEKGVHVLGPAGRAFTPASIGMALAMRNLGQELRETGVSRGFNAAFTPRDRSAFLGELDRIIRRSLAMTKP